MKSSGFHGSLCAAVISSPAKTALGKHICMTDANAKNPVNNSVETNPLRCIILCSVLVSDCSALERPRRNAAGASHSIDELTLQGNRVRLSGHGGQRSHFYA